MIYISAYFYDIVEKSLYYNVIKLISMEKATFVPFKG